MFSYIKETAAEMKHVVWPKQNQVIFWTILILVISIFVAYYLDLFDSVFTFGLEQIVDHAPADGDLLSPSVVPSDPDSFENIEAQILEELNQVVDPF